MLTCLPCDIKMQPYRSNIYRKTLQGQGMEIIANVLRFMQEAANNKTFTIPLNKVQERVAMATGVSKSVIKEIRKEMQKVEAGTVCSYSTPKRNTNRSRPCTDLDDFDMCTIRRTINEFYIYEKTVPTVKAVLKVLQQTINYKGKASSLLKVFKSLGFRWKKMRDNRRLLIEKREIRSARVAFLRSIKKYRQEGRTIVYTDETYIHSSHTMTSAWTDDSAYGYMAPTSKGQRLIIVHAGTEKGFIPGAQLIFKSNQSTGDYHREMNDDNFMRWVTEKLKPNLPEKSVLIIDNASYHNVVREKCPTTSTKKQEMQDWLRNNKIPDTTDMLKIDLK